MNIGDDYGGWKRKNYFSATIFHLKEMFDWSKLKEDDGVCQALVYNWVDHYSSNITIKLFQQPWNVVYTLASLHSRQIKARFGLEWQDL